MRTVKIGQEGWLEQGFKKGLAEGKAEGKAEGLAEGKAEGLAEGKVEGLAEGKAEGLAEGKAEVVMRMLTAGEPEDKIRRMTGVSKKELELLKRGLKVKKK